MKPAPHINRLARHEWLILVVALVLLAATLGLKNGLGRIDLTLYDKAVQLHATMPAGLPDTQSIISAPAWLTAMLSIIPALCALIAYLWLSPRLSLVLTLFLLALTGSASYLALKSGMWIPPGAALLTLALAYPLWRWQRLESVVRYLGNAFLHLDSEPYPLPESDRLNLSGRLHFFDDPLETHICAMERATQRVRDLRQFVTDSLRSVPDATLVSSVDGHVILVNQAASDYFLSIGFPQLADALLPYLFSTMTTPRRLQQTADTEFTWWDLLDLNHTVTMQSGVEVCDINGRNLIIKSTPCRDAGGELTGWIVGVADISVIRNAERSRDEILHFISHDMRSPQASILALIELQQYPASALPQNEFLSRIKKACHITLDLADNFVHLANAESQNYHLEITDFREMLLDACDEMWSVAKAKEIIINTDIPGDDYPVNVNRVLITRVLSNLLSNAVKYSPHNSTINASLKFKHDSANPHIVCTISDQGCGIARADQARLFQRFQRFTGESQPTNDGVGLAMLFIKAVLDRHNAQISFVSVPSEGTTFSITIPVSDAAELH